MKTKKSELFRRCKLTAMTIDNLKPADCIIILEYHYGKRLERIKPSTLYKMIESLMLTATDCIDRKKIVEEVNFYTSC